MNYSIFRPVCVLLLLPGTRVVVAAELKSPDGEIVATVDTNREGGLRYAVAYRGGTVLGESRPGLIFKDALPLEEPGRAPAIQQLLHWKLQPC